MPKVIEILGPSGVGKTSLYKSLQNDWNEEDPWGVYHDIRYKRDPNKRFIHRVFDFLKRKQNTPKQEISYKGANLNDYPKERIFLKDHPEFCNRVVGLINEHSRKSFGGVDKRFINLYIMFETFEHVQAIRERTADKRACLMDEGLLSRLMHLNSPSFSEKTVDEYIQFMPLPDAVIYLQCSPEEILQRAQQKENPSTVHHKLSENEIVEMTMKTIQMMNYAIHKVEKKNVTVYKLNAEREIEVIKQDLINVLKQESNYVVK